LEAANGAMSLEHKLELVLGLLQLVDLILEALLFLFQALGFLKYDMHALLKKKK
jgi:hypothetical protein